MRRTTARRWLVSIGILVIVGGLVWLAVPAVVASVVAGRLQAAGFADVAITRASIGPRGVHIDRLQLAPGDTFVLDDVRLAVTTSSIKRIAVGRLYLETTLGTDGKVVLPGYVAAPGPPGDIVDLVPANGISIGQAELRVATPWRDIVATLDDARIDRESADLAAATVDYVLAEATQDEATQDEAVVMAATETAAVPSSEAAAVSSLAGTATATIERGGAFDARIGIDDGILALGDIRARGLTGMASANLGPMSATPVVELALAVTDTEVGDLAFGPLSLDASLRDGVAELGLTSSSSDAVDLVLNAHAELNDGGPLIDLIGRASFNGPVQGDLAIELSGVSLSDAAATGRLQIGGSGLVIPDVLRGGSINAVGTITGNRERLRFEAANAWTAAFVPNEALLPAAMQPLAEQPAAIAIRSQTQAPLVLSLSLAESSAELEAALQAAAGQSRAEAAARVTVNWGSELAVSAEDLTVNVADLPWNALTLGVDRFAGRADYRGAAWNLAGAGTVEATGSIGAMTLEGLSAQWSGTVTGTPTRVAVTADECIDWITERIAYDTTRIDNLVAPCLQADEAALASYEIAAGRTRFNLSTEAGPMQLHLEREVGADAPLVYDINGTWPDTRLTAAIGGVTGTDLAADLTGGALTVATQDIAVDGIDVAVEIRAGQWQSSQLSVAAIESLAEPAWWAPLSLEASADRSAEAVSFEALLSEAFGTFIVEATGQADAERGAAEVMLYPVQFISGATEIGDISPLLATYVQEATGGLGFEGALDWGPDGLASTGRLRLDQFGVTVADIRVAGIDTQTDFASLWPLATLPEQRAEIATISLGVPLENGLVIYDLDADGRIRIHSLAFDIAGGRIRSDAFTVDSGAGGDIQFTLVVEEAELAQMLELSKINGVQGTGVLSGSIPIRISDGELRLDDGRLASSTGGTLRYTPTNLPAFLRGNDQRTQMLREVLTNFQYDELSATVSGDSGEGGQQTVRFEAQGANPDFLDGHPIELAFTFQGPLLGAMSSAVNVAGAAEIEDLYEQQQLDNLENTQ